MSCNGCRILRKRCNDNCILRQSLQGIDAPQAQANATVFVAKFFGRAVLISFLSSAPESRRPALFRSLLYEACGRTVNPVSGSVGLMWTGNWHVCQSAVETVLRGGVLSSLPEFEYALEGHNSELYQSSDLNAKLDRRGFEIDRGTSGVLDPRRQAPVDFPARMTAGGRVNRQASPEGKSETTSLESGLIFDQNKLLQLFF